MGIDNPILFNRRGFLKSAALLGGAAALAVESVPAAGASTPRAALPFEQSAGPAGQSLTTLSYWSRDGLVDAGTLISGDPSLMESGVRVTIEDYVLPNGISPLFRGLVALFIVGDGSQSASVPFYAWAPNIPVKRSSFFMPVSPANGILFSLMTTAPQSPVESYYLAVDSAGASAKLRTGLYVLAAGFGRAGRVERKRENGILRLADGYDQPPYFEHLLIDVAKAE